MKKAITMVLLAVCIIMLAVCTKAQKNTFQVKNGMYVNKTNEMGAHVFFNTEHLRWTSGAGLVMSYAVGGKYQINGNQIIAKLDDPLATWEGIEAGRVSSQLRAGYKHCSVYKNIFD